MLKKPLSLGMLIAVIATAISTMPAMIQTTFDDIFWQIAEGRDILLGHIPHDVPNAIHSGTWIDHEWLFEVLAAATYDHHCYPVLIAVCACLAAVVPLLIFASVRNEEHDDFGAGIAALCSAVIMLQYDAIRPLQFGVASFALLFYLLRKKKFKIWPYAALALFWANVHASVVLAPIVCSIFALGAIHSREYADARRYGIAMIASAIGSLCTPSGLTLYTYAAAHLGSGSTHYIAEWNPFVFAGLLDWLGMGSVILATAAAWKRADIAPAERTAALTFIMFAFHQQRQISFVVIAAAGVMVHAFSEYRRLCVHRTIFTPIALGALLANAIVDAPLLARANVLQQHPELPKLYAHIPLHNPPLHAYIDYDTAGYAAFIHAPLRILIDSHADCFSASTWQDWDTLARLTPGWQDVIKRNAIQLVIIEKKAPLAQALILIPRWHRITEAGNYVTLTDTSLSEVSFPSSPSISSSAANAAMRSITNASMPR